MSTDGVNAIPKRDKNPRRTALKRKREASRLRRQQRDALKTGSTELLKRQQQVQVSPVPPVPAATESMCEHDKDNGGKRQKMEQKLDPPATAQIVVDKRASGPFPVPDPVPDPVALPTPIPKSVTQLDPVLCPTLVVAPPTATATFNSTIERLWTQCVRLIKAQKHNKQGDVYRSTIPACQDMPTLECAHSDCLPLNQKDPT